jgi:hypothetical protein
MLRAITGMIELSVESTELYQYPEFEFFPSGECEAFSILLHLFRILLDLGLFGFTPIKQIILSRIEYFNDFRVIGEYSHL